jgi:hypothetical protein
MRGDGEGMRCVCVVASEERVIPEPCACVQGVM